MEDKLIALGLTQPQASLYLYLLNKGVPQKPVKIAQSVSQSRTNTYKLLDDLIKLGIVRRRRDGATYSYEAEDPMALTSMASRARNEAIRLEQQVKSLVPVLKDIHDQKKSDTTVASQPGKTGILNAYLSHAKKDGAVYFIRSRADIPFMGFDAMHRIRSAPFEYGHRRYGITLDTPDASLNPQLDATLGLTRTWIDPALYTAPVEWSVNEKELLIVDYSGDGRAIRIESEAVASAFSQLWKLMDEKIHADPDYVNMPRRAERKV